MYSGSELFFGGFGYTQTLIHGYPIIYSPGTPEIPEVSVRGLTWQFQALPFGLSSAPYVFTKLMKPMVSTLRKLGICLFLYLNDMLIMAASKDETRGHLATVIQLLLSLGFIINLMAFLLTRNWNS